MTKPGVEEVYDTTCTLPDLANSEDASSAPSPRRPHQHLNTSTSIESRLTSGDIFYKTKPNSSMSSYCEAEAGNNNTQEVSTSDTANTQSSPPSEILQPKSSSETLVLKDPSSCVYEDCYKPDGREAPLLQLVLANLHNVDEALRDEIDELEDAQNKIEKSGLGTCKGRRTTRTRCRGRYCSDSARKRRLLGIASRISGGQES